MSTKIYNAYKFPKKLNINELTDVVLAQKKIITQEAQKMYFSNCIRSFVEFYDQVNFHPKRHIKEHIEELNCQLENETDLYQQKILCCLSSAYTQMLERNYPSALIDIDWLIDNYIKMYKREQKLVYSDYDYSSKLLIIPYKSKLLAMTFGNTHLNNMLVQNLALCDYHYQDQSDRPRDISPSEWRTRKNTWDKAIGPDYIPNNHGFTFEMVDESELSIVAIRINKDTFLTREYLHSCIPSLEQRVDMVVQSCKDYPNPPSSNAPYSEMAKYLRSDVYNKWRTKKQQVVQMVLKKDEQKVVQILERFFYLDKE